MLVETTSPPLSERVILQSHWLVLSNYVLEFTRLLFSCRIITCIFDLFVDFTVREILTDPNEVQQFMQNLSIPPSVAEGLLNSTVNTREVRFL